MLQVLFPWGFVFIRQPVKLRCIVHGNALFSIQSKLTNALIERRAAANRALQIFRVLFYTASIDVYKINPRADHVLPIFKSVLNSPLFGVDAARSVVSKASWNVVFIETCPQSVIILGRRIKPLRNYCAIFNYY